MFYGEYEHTLDRKGRLIIPAKLREVFKEQYCEKFYVTRGLDRCLFVFTEEEWKNQERVFKNMSFTKTESRKFNRLYFSGACDVLCDKQGRILLPDYLKSYAGIKKDVMVIGVSNRIEIWDLDEWKRYYEQAKDSFEDIAEKLVDRGEG
ncbi:MAG: division/cell wall cluster transcriptional repressor MraZ [Candidatus Omnitrophica bacterium]|nr:division/cell wall cluster transcriptional repressor MraZ [Candidatus Omnitrophota bacterium]